MSGFFKVKSNVNLSDLKVGDRIETSDYAQITPDGKFVQLEYVEEEETTTNFYDVKPGIWTIHKNQIQGMHLIPTTFVKDSILTSLINTKEITDKVDCFFRNIHIYAEYGIEVAKRALLLYGPPGTGKTTAINLIAQDYSKDGKTAVVVWATDKFESFEVKDFIKRFNYVNGVEKIILVVEDIGGIEMDQVRMKSDSSLLSLLDNQEKTFKIPVLILATTNYPEVFQGNLTNRPQRFDDKIKVPLPTGEDRRKLLAFFSKDKASTEALDLVATKQCDKFSTAHLKEAIIRSSIYEKSLISVLEDIIKEIQTYEKAFDDKTGRMGLG